MRRAYQFELPTSAQEVRGLILPKTGLRVQSPRGQGSRTIHSRYSLPPWTSRVCVVRGAGWRPLPSCAFLKRSASRRCMARGNCITGSSSAVANSECGLRVAELRNASGRVVSRHAHDRGRACVVRSRNVGSWIALLNEICNTIGQIQTIFQDCYMKPRSGPRKRAVRSSSVRGVALM